MSMEWCSATGNGIRLAVQVAPHASRSQVVGVVGDALRIRLAAQPVEGKANEALVRFLAAKLELPLSAVRLMRGHTSKRKIVLIEDRSLSVEQVRALLREPDGNGSHA